MSRRQVSVTATHGLPDVIVNAAGFDQVEPFMNNDSSIAATLARARAWAPNGTRVWTLAGKWVAL